MKFDNKFRNTLLKVVTNPFLLSFIFTFVVIFSLPPIFNKYDATIVHGDRDARNKQIYFSDLDGDGTSERISIEQVYPNLIGIIVSKNDRILDQWNFTGKLLAMRPPLWGDIDGDGLNEIFVFVYNEKKIYLNCFNPVTNMVFYKDKFVVAYKPVDERLDCGVLSLGFYDNNYDGKNEFY
ncbi:MAG: hypothetical protein HYV29_04840, partial [Ignavibacteriales bacterium]|nr:hypothetical protein [Ignavibacteriales bacterium]